jgi:hypothetical protein
MKIAVLKFGVRVSENIPSGTVAEVIGTAKLFQEAGHEVEIFTWMTNGDKEVHGIKIRSIDEHFDKIDGKFDSMFVFNGNLNFYGGEEKPFQLNTYRAIHRFNSGPIFYFFTDPLTPYVPDAWPMIEKRSWGSKYPKEELDISHKKMILISAGKDMKKVESCLSNLNKSASIDFPIAAHTLALFRRRELFNSMFKTTDLIYGGSYRSGNRADKMIKFYFDLPKDISVEMFGKISAEDFGKKINGIRTPIFSDQIRLEKFFDKMSTGLTSVIIGDNWYENNWLTPRFFESIISNNVTFVDIDYDPEKLWFFENEELSNFCYVSSREEAVEKIRKVKNDDDFAEKIVNMQNDHILEVKKRVIEMSKTCLELYR